MTRTWLWRKLCGESCCGESYVAKVIVKWQRGESYVAKVAVANMKRGESYSALKCLILKKNFRLQNPITLGTLLTCGR